MSKKYYKGFNKDDGKNKNGIAVIVDGEAVKADTWYTLKDGELVDVQND
jgi:hypothetical protein